MNSNYNTREEILASSGPISFDGAYSTVWFNQNVLLDRDVTLFVTGSFVGGNNRFDDPMPFETFCDWNQIMQMVIQYGCRLGWHTWTHKDLTLISDAELLYEVTPPFPMDHFAYPYGKFNANVIEAVRTAGFKTAWGVFDGDNSDFQKTRRYLNW